MGCISSLSATVLPERSYWTALIEFMRMRQQSQSLSELSQTRTSFAEVSEYADAGIVAAANELAGKTKFSDQEIEDYGYLGWLTCAN